MGDSLFGSPARSIGDRSLGDPNSLTDSEITESESEFLEMPSEAFGTPDQAILEGWLKFRDNKKWKQRWGVVTKFSPAADCLHLQLYRDSRDRYKQGQTKASLSLQHFLGVETGFTLDKESNTIAIVCQDVTVVLAFDTRERLIQWQVKISCNLGEDQQFLVLVSQAPSKAKISTGPARLHVQEMKFCMTSGVPPRLIGFWEIGHLRRYGVIEGRFCFEGGSRCGKGEGLYVLVTDQGAEITRTLQMAAQGKLASRRKQVVRKSSVMDSPRKFLDCKTENRGLDVLQDVSFEGDANNQSECPSGSPYWSVESRRTDLDSDFGCGDTASVHMHPENAWQNPDGRAVAPCLERCVSCISKLGAPTMSRSSTANTSTLFSPAWTMDPVSFCQHQNMFWNSGSDRMSVTSHGTGSSGSGNSEYAVDRLNCLETRFVQNSCPPLPPKFTNSEISAAGSPRCQCCPPSRPPKPTKEPPSDSPSRRKVRKPPMPLPSELSQGYGDQSSLGPYENYDIPRNIIKDVGDKQPLREALNNRQSSSPAPSDFYDTPKSVKENMCFGEVAGYGNYDTPPPAKTIRKPCGCVVTFARQAIDSEPRGECPCQRVLCWAENWMILPYCRRGRGIENTAVPIHKVRLSGEGKMPVVNPSGEIAVYATIDKSKKGNKPEKENEAEVLEDANYENVNPPEEEQRPKNEKDVADYENIEFAHSLAYYENSKDLLQKVGITSEDLDNLTQNTHQEPEVSFSVNNGVKVCNKCGHACDLDQSKDPPPPEQLKIPEQEDYLVMEPSQGASSIKQINLNFPGYLPMFPGNKAEVMKLLANRNFPPEKSASVSSLPSAVLKGRKRSDSEARVPGSAMLVMPSSANPYVKKLLGLEDQRRKQLPRKRSSSADSSRHLGELDENESRGSSLSSPSKTCSETEKPTSNSLTSLPYQSPKKTSDAKGASEEIRAEATEDFCEKTIVADAPRGTEKEESAIPNSSQPLAHEDLADDVAPGALYIRRSSSVPCKSGNNRDSSGSNDSGVSTGSFKHRGKDFAEFELPLTTAMSSRRHQSVSQRHPGATCLHASLPRRSKSSDPLRELSFQFQTTKIPAKSSSAEAEVPLCTTKKGYFSPGDGISVPYMDSRSTSSGTSDMSDYIETLSLSSHSSSDAPDSSLQRISRVAATTLRPRSGNEYHKIDRSILSGDIAKNQKGHYANIGPLPEKSESPSPGYMSSSPAHEVQCTDF